MKKTLSILLLFLIIGFSANAQTANAGSDQLVYLTQGNSVVLGSSLSSGTTYSWSKITGDGTPRLSTAISDPSTIVNPSSKQTLVRGLIQGAWPYQLAVTTSGTTVYDTVVVRVAYSVPPLNYTQLDSITSYNDLNQLANPQTVSGTTYVGLNDRSDTLTFHDVGSGASQFWNAYHGSSYSIHYYTFCNTEKLFLVNKSRSILYSTEQDNVPSGRGYERVQLLGSTTGNPEAQMDTNHIYVTELQTFFTKNPSEYFANSSHDVLFGFDRHGQSTSNPFSLDIGYPNTVKIEDHIGGDQSGNHSIYATFSTSTVATDSLTNKPHTFRLYERMGFNGFIKLTYDGITLYERLGEVGDPYYANFSSNWLQVFGFYDFGSELCSYSNTTRGRVIGLGTTGFRFGTISDTSQFTRKSPPSVYINGGDQTVLGSTASATCTATAGSGTTISVYHWSILLGNGTIASPSSSTTNISGLSGITILRQTVTQSDGQQAFNDITITTGTPSIPSCNAGANQSLPSGTTSTTLTGTASDVGGTIVSTQWTLISAPNTPTIVSSTSLTTSITGLIAGTSVFQLSATDNNGNVATSQVSVTVQSTSVPHANSGGNQTLAAGTTRVFLDGSHSTVTNGTIVGYQWTQTAGATSNILHPLSDTTTVTGLTVGKYTYKLTITDNNGNTSTDSAIILVNNSVLTANAGSNQSIYQGVTATVSASGSTDPGGTISSYIWTQTSGTGATITTPSNVSTAITGLHTGTNVFQVTVGDTYSNSSNASVIITVNPTVPSASAGANQTITTSSTTLTGTGSVTGGSVASYAWTQTFGATSTIVSPSSATTSVTGLTAGTYNYKLTVTDNNGNTASSTMSVVVTGALPIPTTKVILSHKGRFVIINN